MKFDNFKFFENYVNFSQRYFQCRIYISLKKISDAFIINISFKYMEILLGNIFQLKLSSIQFLRYFKIVYIYSITIFMTHVNLHGPAYKNIFTCHSELLLFREFVKFEIDF